jgi:hypothetical protein
VSTLDEAGAQVRQEASWAWVANNYRLSVAHRAAETAGQEATTTLAAGVIRLPANPALEIDNTEASFTSKANRNPAFPDQSVSVSEGAAPGSAVASLTASDPDGQDLSYHVTGGSGAGKFNVESSTGTLSPAEKLDFESRKEYSLQVQARDPVDGENTAEISITVQDANDAPRLSDVSFRVDKEQGKTVTLSASDQDGDSLSYSRASLPEHGVANINGAELTYEPVSGFTGTDSFSVAVADGNGGTDTATVSVTVQEPDSSGGGSNGGGGGGGCAATGRSAGPDPVLGLLVAMAGLGAWRRRIVQFG